MKAVLVYSNDDGFSLGVEMLRSVVEQRVPRCEVEHSVWFHEPWGNLTTDYLGQYNAFLGRLHAQRPDVLAFSTFVWNHDDFARMGEMARRHLPACRIVWGGGQTDSRRMADHLLRRYAWLDYVVRGEGEDSYPALLRALAADTDLAGVAGLSWRCGAEIRHNQDAAEVDLTELPMFFTPARLDLDQILRRNARAVLSYETGRGCRQKCGFCLYSSSRLRVFGMDRVRTELAFLLDHAIPQLRICDAHLGISRTRAMEIFEIVRTHNRGTVVDVYPDTKHVDAEYAQALNRAGCRVISLGIQSSDPTTLRLAGRRFDEARFIETATLLRRHHNHQLAADIIIGLPGDNYDKVCDSVRFAYRSGIQLVHFAPLMAFPGTEFFEHAEDYQLEFFDFAPPLVARSQGFDTEDYGRAMVMARQVEALQNQLPTLLRCLLALDDTDPVAFAESLDPDGWPQPLVDAPQLVDRIRTSCSAGAAQLLEAGLAWDRAGLSQRRADPVPVPDLADDAVIDAVDCQPVQWLDVALHRLVADFSLRWRDLGPGRTGYLRPPGGLAVYHLSGPLQLAFQAAAPGLTFGELRRQLTATGVGAAVAAEAVRILARCAVVRPAPVPRVAAQLLRL